LNEVDLIPVIVNQRLQESAKLVWVIDKNLQNFFNLYRLLVGAVCELNRYFLATGNLDYLTGDNLHMVHEPLLADFNIWVG
jgi:hypothetical protein